MQAVGLVYELMAAVCGLHQIYPSPALVNVGYGKGVIINAIIVFVQQIIGGVDQRGFDQGRTGAVTILFLVEIAHHGGATRHQGGRH